MVRWFLLYQKCSFLGNAFILKYGIVSVVFVFIISVFIISVNISDIIDVSSDSAM